MNSDPGQPFGDAEDVSAPCLSEANLVRGSAIKYKNISMHS